MEHGASGVGANGWPRSDATAGITGRRHRRKNRPGPAPAPHDDLVQTPVHRDAPDRVWFTDITQHRASDGWVYCCAVIDAYSRRCVGLVDRRPRATPSSSPTPSKWPAGNAVPAWDDRPRRPRPAIHVVDLRPPAPPGRPPRVHGTRRLLASTTPSSSRSGRRCNANSSTDSTGLHAVELASAIFEWIEGCYNPRRRHTSLTDDRGRSLSPVTFEALHTHAENAA